MSMSFDTPLTNEQSELLNKFLDTKKIAVVAQDDRNVLFDTFSAQRNEMSKLANDLGQPVTVEINNPGEIKTMSDGTKYRVTPQGWKKI